MEEQFKQSVGEHINSFSFLFFGSGFPFLRPKGTGRIVDKLALEEVPVASLYCTQRDRDTSVSVSDLHTQT